MWTREQLARLDTLKSEGRIIRHSAEVDPHLMIADREGDLGEIHADGTVTWQESGAANREEQS